MNRNHVFVTLGVVVLVLGVAFMLGGGCGGLRIGPSIHWGDGIWNGRVVENGVELPHRRTLPVSTTVTPPGRLEVNYNSASITIDGDAATTIASAEFEVYEKEPGDADVEWTPDGPRVTSRGGHPVHVAAARIKVPAKTSVSATTQLGSVRVSGIAGVEGVTAKSSAGRVEVRKVSDLSSVSATSDLGQVTLEDAANVAEVTLATDAGSVSAHRVSGARTISLRTSLGSVSAGTVEASEELSLRSESGSVIVEDARTAKLKMKTSLGSITARRAAVGHLDAHADAGSVKLKGCTYQTKSVGTSLGKVTED